MFGHYILLSSSYKEGLRIAMDFTFEESLSIGDILNTFNKIHEECGDDVLLSTHSIVTDSEEWSSVEKKDPFFKGIRVCTLDEFIAYIKKDSILTGVDVAKYILSKIECTHLKLQKLTYLAYADYLCKTGERLFDDKICAFKYGPVVLGVYEKYKKFKDKEIDDVKIMKIPDELKLPTMSRVMFSTEGITKKSSIEGTLEMYGDMTAQQLVELTHMSGTPWTKSYTGEYYKPMTDDDIRIYHANEAIQM